MTLRLRFCLFLLFTLFCFSIFGFSLLSIAPAVAGGIISGLGSLAGSIFGSNSAAEAQGQANAYNYQNWVEQRLWSEKLANTAHVREVADLRAAGLNPVLSAGGGGATTPSSQAPTMEPVNHGAWANNIGASIGTALSVMQAEKDLKVKDAEIVSKAANAQAALGAAQNSRASAAATEAEMPSIRARASSASDEAKLRSSKTKFDEKMVKFDGYLQRVLNSLGGVVDVFNVRRMLEGTRNSEQHRRYREDEMLHRNGRRGVPTTLP